MQSNGALTFPITLHVFTFAIIVHFQLSIMPLLDTACPARDAFWCNQPVRRLVVHQHYAELGFHRRAAWFNSSGEVE